MVYAQCWNNIASSFYVIVYYTIYTPYATVCDKRNIEMKRSKNESRHLIRVILLGHCRGRVYHRPNGLLTHGTKCHALTFPRELKLCSRY